jgi:hypothetical protein
VLCPNYRTSWVRVAVADSGHVDGSGLARDFFTSAASVAAAMLRAEQAGL